VADDAKPINVLKGAGLRPTETRQRVLAALSSAGRSLSHAELADALPDLDRVTVFRSLKILKKARLVHSVRGTDGTARFGPNPAETPGCPGGHPHFLCVECGSMTCLPDQAMPDVRVPRGALVHGKQLVVYGVCAQCAASIKAQTGGRSLRAATHRDASGGEM
jgi:Fur family transcriptional regulator, ferric uptake regulator